MSEAKLKPVTWRTWIDAILCRRREAPPSPLDLHDEAPDNVRQPEDDTPIVEKMTDLYCDGDSVKLCMDIRDLTGCGAVVLKATAMLTYVHNVDDHITALHYKIAQVMARLMACACGGFLAGTMFHSGPVDVTFLCYQFGALISFLASDFYGAYADKTFVRSHRIQASLRALDEASKQAIAQFGKAANYSSRKKVKEQYGIPPARGPEGLIKALARTDDDSQDIWSTTPPEALINMFLMTNDPEEAQETIEKFKEVSSDEDKRAKLVQQILDATREHHANIECMKVQLQMSVRDQGTLLINGTPMDTWDIRKYREFYNLHSLG
jgi:hypothetical protein